MQAYFPESSEKLNYKLATPLLAAVEELKGSPPALVIVAESDLLRGEGEANAHKLLEAEVETQAVRVLGAGKSFAPADR